MPVNTLLQMRRGTAATWTSTNPTLGAGEWGYETDTGRAKVGDGVTVWTSLKYTKLRYDDIFTGSGISITPVTDGNSQVTGLYLNTNLVAGDNITLVNNNGAITINGEAGMTLSEGTGIHIVVDGDNHEINVSGLTSSLISDFNSAVDARVTAASISEEQVLDIVSTGLYGGTGIHVVYDDGGKGQIELHVSGLKIANIEDITASAAEINVLDNVVAGTVSAGDAVVVDGNKDISGFNQVSATTFAGDLTGNASSASQIKTQSSSTDAEHFLTFVDSNNGSATNETLYTDAGISYNPSSNTLYIGALTAGSNVNIGGNLTVSGTTTTVNSTTVDIGDNIIQVNVSGAETQGGIQVYDHDNTEAHRLIWDITNSRWEFIGDTSPDIYTSGNIIANIITSTVANGTAPLAVTSTTVVANFNADKLDGQEGYHYLDWTNATNKPDPIITGLLTGAVTGIASVTLTDLDDGLLSIETTIIDGAIDTDQLADGAVTSDKIENGTIVDIDISDIANINIAKLSASGITIGNTEYYLGDTTTALSGMTSFAGTDASNPVRLYWAVIDGGSPQLTV